MKDRVQKPNIGNLVTKLLESLPEKNREILTRRFGIGYDKSETLDSIGKRRNITRERVRQLQEYGLKKLMQYDDSPSSIEPIFIKVRDYIAVKGGVVKHADIFEYFVRPQEAGHLSLALRLMPDLLSAKETEDLHARYAFSDAALKSADEAVYQVHAALENLKIPVSSKALADFGNKNILALSKRIKEGPFGDFGLSSWSRIEPRGVRDKAHLVFEREKRPLHFRDISKLVDKYFSSSKAKLTHPQTVHNELIKDPRFVLIGRGLYALAEWGYEPGTVKDVLVQILKEQGGPLEKEGILAIISERRFVRPNTVFLNLQNKYYFKRLEDGKYYLAS